MIQIGCGSFSVAGRRAMRGEKIEGKREKKGGLLWKHYASGK